MCQSMMRWCIGEDSIYGNKKNLDTQVRKFKDMITLFFDLESLILIFSLLLTLTHFIHWLVLFSTKKKLYFWFKKLRFYLTIDDNKHNNRGASDHRIVIYTIKYHQWKKLENVINNNNGNKKKSSTMRTLTIENSCC